MLTCAPKHQDTGTAAIRTSARRHFGTLAITRLQGFLTCCQRSSQRFHSAQYPSCTPFGRRDERAVAAVAAHDRRDVRIAGDGRIGKGSGGTNGSSAALMMSAGAESDRRRAATRRGSSSRWRRESRSAAPCRPRRSRARSGCDPGARLRSPLRKRRDLAAHAALQVAHEVPLVGEVAAAARARDARGRSITGDTATDGFQQTTAPAAVVAGQLQGQVPAQRVPDHAEPRQAFSSTSSRSTQSASAVSPE